MAGSVYTYVGNADRSNRTASLLTSQGVVQVGQSGLFLISEYQALVGEGAILTPGPAVSPVSQLLAPVVASGGAGVLNGTYRYVWTFVTAAGETVAGPETSIALAGQQASLTAAPVGSALSGVLARRLYRTPAGGASGSELLVTTISDNTTTTYIDNLADGSLGVAVPTVDTAGVLVTGGSISPQASYAKTGSDGYVGTVGQGGTPLTPAVVNSALQTRNVKSYGAAVNGVLVSDATMSLGTPTVVTSASNGFATAQPGMAIMIEGATTGGITLNVLTTTIASVQSAGQVTLTAPATVAVTGVTSVYGTDDTAAINAALALGGDVLLPAGIAVTTAALVPASNTRFRGLGRGISTIWCVNASVASAANNEVIGGNPGGMNIHLSDMTVNLAQGGLRQNCKVIGAAWVNFRIENIEVDSSPCLGIQVFSNTLQCGPGVITRCTVKNTLADGIFVSNCAGVRVADNYVASTGDDGISLHSGNGGSSYTLQDCVVTNNVVVNAGSRGIVTFGGIGVIISNNRVNGTFCAGILVITANPTLAAQDISVSNNQIVNVGTVAQPSFGATITSYMANIAVIANNSITIDSVKISGNIMRGGKSHHIFVVDIANTGSITNLSIENNWCIGALSATLNSGQIQGGTTMAGIYVDGVPSGYTGHVRISNNHVDGSLHEGVYIGTHTGGVVDIMGNYIQNSQGSPDSTSSAIKFGAGVAGQITGNTVNDSGHYSYGIDVTAATQTSMTLKDNFLGTYSINGWNAVTSPAPVSGTALQDATGLASTVYVALTGGTGGTVTVAIGPTSGVANVIIPVGDATLSRTVVVRLPPNWWYKVTVGGSAAIASVKQIPA